MGKSVNQVFLIGRLTRDVELRSTQTGKQVAKLSLAVDKQYGEGTDFFDCTAWEKTAELLSQYTKKGSRLHVQGTLQQQTWEQDGQKRSKVEVLVRDVVFLADNSTKQAPVKKDTVVENVGSEPINLDDIPF